MFCCQNPFAHASDVGKHLGVLLVQMHNGSQTGETFLAPLGDTPSPFSSLARLASREISASCISSPPYWKGVVLSVHRSFNHCRIFFQDLQVTNFLLAFGFLLFGFTQPFVDSLTIVMVFLWHPDAQVGLRPVISMVNQSFCFSDRVKVAELMGTPGHRSATAWSSVGCASLMTPMTGTSSAATGANTCLRRSLVLSVTCSAVTIRPVNTSRTREIVSLP